MSWPQIACIIAATAAPFFLWGFKRGYARAWREIEGRSTLMRSAGDKAWADNLSEGGS